MKKSVLYTLCAICLFVFGGCNKTSYDGDERIVQVSLTENGESYSVPAVEGQAIVMFRGATSEERELAILAENNLEVITHISRAHYYLVSVPAGKESEVIAQLQTYDEVDMSSPNALEEVNAVHPYVMDNFVGEHGNKVVSMMQGCNMDLDVQTYDVSSENSRRYMSQDKIIASFTEILSDLSYRESAVINMSFGPSLGSLLPFSSRALWDDFWVTNSYRKTYRRQYVYRLKQLVKLSAYYDNKDFVVTKSSGNEGMKQLEQIVDELRQELSPAENGILERHYILVSAKDDNKTDDYPNDVSEGHYDKMVTKVDISDMTAQDLHWQGTSFSSPRLAGCIVEAATTSKIKVIQTLAYVRSATRRADDHVISCESLQDELKIRYVQYGDLRYRLFNDDESGVGRLELYNPTAYEMHVRGVLTNATAPRGGDNTIEFDETIEPEQTVFVDGFIDNRCKIKTVQTDGDDVSEDGSDPTETLSIEDIVRKFGISLATEDLETLKQVTTDNFYKELMATYPIGRRMVTKQQKKLVRKAFEQLRIEIKESSDGEIIAMLMGRGRHSDYYLCYQDGWKICDYGKNGVPVLKSKKLR